MCPDRVSPRRQTGSILPVVVMVLVLLAVLGTAMIELNATGQRSVALEVLSTRAFHAAESGAQYGMRQVFPLDGAPPVCTNWNLNFAAEGLRGCRAAVACAANPANPIQGSSYFTLTSTGSCGSGEVLASRTLEVGVRR